MFVTRTQDGNYKASTVTSSSRCSIPGNGRLIFVNGKEMNNIYKNKPMSSSIAALFCILSPHLVSMCALHHFLVV